MGKKMHWENHLGSTFFNINLRLSECFFQQAHQKILKSQVEKKKTKLQVAAKQKNGMPAFFKQPIFSNLGS